MKCKITEYSQNLTESCQHVVRGDKFCYTEINRRKFHVFGRKSDQAWNFSYTIKAALKVKYDYSGNSLKIYKNDQFQRNGTVSNTITSDSGVFTNTTLMGNNTEVRNPTIAGVVYSIYASRGVSVEVPVSLA